MSSWLTELQQYNLNNYLRSCSRTSYYRKKKKRYCGTIILGTVQGPATREEEVHILGTKKTWYSILVNLWYQFRSLLLVYETCGGRHLIQSLEVNIGTGVEKSTSIIWISWLKKSHSIFGDIWFTAKCKGLEFCPVWFTTTSFGKCWKADHLDNAREPSLRSRRKDLNWTMLMSSHWENPTIGGKLIN